MDKLVTELTNAAVPLTREELLRLELACLQSLDERIKALVRALDDGNRCTQCGDSLTCQKMPDGRHMFLETSDSRALRRAYDNYLSDLQDLRTQRTFTQHRIAKMFHRQVADAANGI